MSPSPPEAYLYVYDGEEYGTPQVRFEDLDRNSVRDGVLDRSEWQAMYGGAQGIAIQLDAATGIRSPQLQAMAMGSKLQLAGAAALASPQSLSSSTSGKELADGVLPPVPLSRVDTAHYQLWANDGRDV